MLKLTSFAASALICFTLVAACQDSTGPRAKYSSFALNRRQHTRASSLDKEPVS
jgi:hypothetical protein